MIKERSSAAGRGQHRQILIIVEALPALLTQDPLRDADAEAHNHRVRRLAHALSHITQIERASGVHLVVICQQLTPDLGVAGLRDNLLQRIVTGHADASHRRLHLMDADSAPLIEKDAPIGTAVHPDGAGHQAVVRSFFEPDQDRLRGLLATVRH